MLYLSKIQAAEMKKTIAAPFDIESRRTKEDRRKTALDPYITGR